MATKKAEQIIRIYARVNKISPTQLIRKFDRIKNVGDKARVLKSYTQELLKAKARDVGKDVTQQDLEKDASRWYRNLLKQAKTAGATKMAVGYFYHYTYKSDYYPDFLSQYDTKPLIFLFDINRGKPTKRTVEYYKGATVGRMKTYLLGINFHWLSKANRIKILNAMLKANPKAFEEDQPISVRYDAIKSGFAKGGYVAIRRYIRTNIKKKVLRIPNMEMLNVVNLPSDKFTGITPERAIQLSQSKRQYRSDVLLNAEKLKKLIKKYGAEKGKRKYEEWKRARMRETYKRF